MLREERWLRIESYIREREFVSYADMLRDFGVSKSTAYRDLEMICKNHSDIVFTRGGVMCIKGSVGSEATLSNRSTQFTPEKQRIAKAAAEMIHPKATVYLDSGTTNREMIPYLLEMDQIQIITNDLVIAVELTKNVNIDVLVVGGLIRKDFCNSLGYKAESFMQDIRCDIAFLNVDAVDATRGYMNSNMEEVAMKKAVLQAANRTVVLCDHSKFETAAFMSICGFTAVDLLITDDGVAPEVVQMLQTKKAKVKLV